jgi:hypothetical protein
MNDPHTFTIMTFHPISPVSFVSFPQRINTAQGSKRNSHAMRDEATTRKEFPEVTADLFGCLRPWPTVCRTRPHLLRAKA